MDIELFSIQTFSEDTMLFIKKEFTEGGDDFVASFRGNNTKIYLM